MVSLECNQEMNFDVGINCLLGESSQLSQGSRILYDNIEMRTFLLMKILIKCKVCLFLYIIMCLYFMM